MNASIVNHTLFLCLELERTRVRTYMIYVDVYLASVLILFGFIGNVISIVILKQDRRMRTVTRSLLVVLAITDLFYLTASAFYQPMFAIAFDPLWGRTFVSTYLIFEPYVAPALSVISTAGIWTVLLVTTDRYLAIRYPLRARTLFTASRIRIFVIAIWIFALLFNAIRFSGARIPHTIDLTSGRVILLIPLEDDLQYNPYYNLIYQVILVFIIRFFVPLAALVFLNFGLITEIHKNTQKDRDSPWTPGVSMKDASRRSTLILIIVVFIFIICMIPTIYCRILWLSRLLRHGESGEDIHLQMYDNQLLYAYSTSKLFLTINSSVNFLVYVAVGKRFRKNLKKTFKLCCLYCRGQRSPVFSRSLTLSTL